MVPAAIACGPCRFPIRAPAASVYPGFLQLSGFMAMNMDRHVNAHVDMFKHLVQGDGDSAEKHREFYDEYLAVMDLTAEFYMQTIETVFVQHALPKGEMNHRGRPVDLGGDHAHGALTIEGEKDDISGLRADRCGAGPLHPPSRRDEAALRADGRRPLRRVQRLALPRSDRAAHRRVHPLVEVDPWPAAADARLAW